MFQIEQREFWCWRAMMRCVAVLGSGARCGREAAGEDGLCRRHRSVAFRRGMRAFQLARAAAEDEEALAPAAELSGLDEEIAVLRVLIRRAVGSRNVDAVRRGVESLRRALETNALLEAAEAGSRAPRRGRAAEAARERQRLDALLDELGRGGAGGHESGGGGQGTGVGETL